MEYTCYASKDRKAVMKVELVPEGPDDSEFLLRLHKAMICSDKILIIDSYENEDGQVRVLEYRSGGEKVDLLAEPRISSEPAVQVTKPSLISIVYQCLSFVVMCGFAGWCLASLLWWLLCSI